MTTFDLFNPAAFDLASAPLTSMTTSLAVGATYVVVILLFELSRRGSAPLGLKTVSMTHNLVLTLWSLFMAVGIAFSVVSIALEHGAYTLLCASQRGLLQRGPLAYFMWHYAISKYYELLDTVLMVLKRKPLTVLHVWHHASIGPLSLSWLVGDWPLSWIGAFLNTVIHVFMYYYYFASSLYGFNPWWKKNITQAQVAQFFTVLVLIFTFTFISASGSFAGLGWTAVAGVPLPSILHTPKCAGDPNVVLISQAVNITFLVLFINFFIQTYSSSSSKSKAAKPKKN